MGREEKISGIQSKFCILSPNGDEFGIDEKSNLKEIPIIKNNVALEKLLNIEILQKDASLGKEPPSVKAMRALELVDYESASDPGHFRFYPKGMLIYNLLRDWAEEIAIKRFNAMEIGTPLIYDWSQPDIKAQGESFHERHYRVQGPTKKKELILRFAGDFGLFRMMKNVNMSYKHLPVRIYEFSNSFRYERSGELVGLRRLRAFSMPDIHCFCRDLDQGWNEYKSLYENYADLADETKIEYAIVFRIVEDFYEKYKENIIKLLKYSRKPALIEILSEMKHYWAVKHEFQFIDSVNGNCQLSTVQLDIEDAERYGITFVNEQGKNQGCIICHSSVGSIERWIFSILEEALKKEVPILPLWLSPIQVRILPITERQVEYSLKITDKLNKEKIRTELDDRNETLNKKIRDAEKNWIPYVIIIGDKEIQNQKISARIRKDGKQKQMKLDELIKEVLDETNNMPFRPLPVSMKLSAQPIFVNR
ncbi:MAG: threonine--tRNA ligase [Candidatus Nealsonbacteria bacterium]|nr:threonine--tRNA ligase [Candidatus Nealsonbacteria bacterium]